MFYVLVDPFTYPYTVTDFRLANPGVSLRIDPDPAALAEFGMFPVTPTEPPAHDPITQDVTRSAELQDDTWVETWTVSDASPEVAQARLNAKRAGMVVTMRQARLVLLGAGLLDSVEAAIASIPNATQRRAAEIDWEYANEVRRISPLIASLAPALGLTDAQIDALFESAAAIQ